MHWERRIGRRLHLRDLHILFAVVQCGGMAKAAAQLGVSSALCIRGDRKPGARGGRAASQPKPAGVEPTMYGEALLYRSRAAFDELRQGIRDIEFLADPTAGELRIACPETLTAGFLPAIIDRLLRKYPRVVFHVVQTSAATRFRELRERNVDLTLARLSNPLTETDVDVQALFNDQVWVVAGARNPLTRRRKIIEFAELAASHGSRYRRTTRPVLLLMRHLRQVA